MRHVFLFALSMVAGCGGCDSCIGKAPGDDAASYVPVQPLPGTTPAARDAGDSDAEPRGDGGRDAGDGGEGLSAAAVPTQPTIPRPKAPMPMGAFQSCGVYDGPLCEKTCPKGACRQECDGVECSLTCAGGYCSQFCAAGGKCKLSCAGGHCVQVCTKADGCTKDCAGGACE